MYSKHTKLCFKNMLNHVCVVPFLRILLYTLLTPKIINTKLYIHPKKPLILNYVANKETNCRQWKPCVPKAPKKNNSNEERREEGTGKD